MLIIQVPNMSTKQSQETTVFVRTTLGTTIRSPQELRLSRPGLRSLIEQARELDIQRLSYSL